MLFASVKVQPDEYSKCLLLRGWESLTGDKSLSTVTEVGDFDPRIHVACIEKIYIDLREKMSKKIIIVIL